VTVDPAVPRKLGIRAGASVRLVNAPAGYAEALRAVAPGAAIVAADPTVPEIATGAGAIQAVDFVHLFCATRAELDALAPAAIAAYRAGGHLWVSYPKGGAKAGTDLNRDVDWGPLAAAGFRPVTQVAIDARWSALRFRRLEEVGR
jgi:hypothetical protein